SSFDLAYYMRGELAASMSVEDDKAPDMWAVVEDHPNAKAWISGHTHANRFAVDLCKPATVAGRGFVHVNLPAPEGPTRTAFDPLVTGFITVWDDRMEVRYRDHASRQWV